MSPLQATELIERLRRNLRDVSKDLGDQLHQRPVRDYRDPQVFDQEQRTLFRCLPLLVGHASQAPNAGDFFTVNFAGPPLLIVRQDDGRLRAFVNSCRHRAAMLTNIAAGHAAAFICPYHGWRYERDGQLTSITAKECFPGVDRAVQGLLELPLRICEGLIFVSIAPDADFNARNWLGPIADLLQGFKLATHQHFRTEVIETAFNWKIGVEGSLETYHFRPLHAESIARIFDGMATVYDHWAPHQRQCVAKPSLLAANDPAGPVALLRAQILQTYFVFPCTLVSITNDHMLLTFFYPRGVTGCTMVYTLLTPAEMSGEAHAKHWERTWQLTRSVLSEDFEVQEGIQRAAEHANDAQLTLGLFEQGLARFHQAIDASGIPPTC